MLNRDEVLERMGHARLFLQAALSGLKNERLAEKVGEHWTVRDILCHLVAWEKEFHKEARAVVRRNGHAFDYRIDPSDDWRAWNASQIEGRAGRATGEIFLEMEQEQAAFLEWLDGVPERRLRHASRWPWGGEGSVLELLSTCADHKVQHAVKIREWRTSQKF